MLECQEIIVIKHTVEIVMDQLTSQVEVVVHYIHVSYTHLTLPTKRIV